MQTPGGPLPEGPEAVVLSSAFVSGSLTVRDTDVDTKDVQVDLSKSAPGPHLVHVPPGAETHAWRGMGWCLCVPRPTRG